MMAIKYKDFYKNLFERLSSEDVKKTPADQREAFNMEQGRFIMNAGDNVQNYYSKQRDGSPEANYTILSFLKQVNTGGYPFTAHELSQEDIQQGKTIKDSDAYIFGLTNDQKQMRQKVDVEVYNNLVKDGMTDPNTHKVKTINIVPVPSNFKQLIVPHPTK